jgi:phospholipid/cholesterol/gamma-HCH transport system substrate-binding protein
MSQRSSGPVRRKILGLVLVFAVLAAVAGVIGGYTQAFVSVTSVTVNADRAGLLLLKRAPVTLRGVKVGEVRSIDARGNAAAIQVALRPDQIPYIPANVTASITTPTLFGAKGIDLTVPAEPSPARIAAGAQINTTAVVTEGNTLLSSLNTLLTSIDPAKLNSALGAVSNGLQGRGDRLGRVLVQVNTYLRKLNPSVPGLTRDLAASTDVTNTYADVTPDLVRVADDLATTSETLVDREPALERLLSDAVTIGDDARSLLKDNGDHLDDLLKTLRPTTAYLDRYSPMFPCLFASLNQVRADLERVIGYDVPGVHTFTSFLPASQGYLNPRDLPKVGPKIPPTCFGGPLTPADVPFPHVIFDDGWEGFVTSDAVTPAGSVLIPPAVPLVGGRQLPPQGGGPRR